MTVRTITGTSGKDPIEGTAGSDKINADAGNDVLFYNLADSLLPATEDVYSGNGGIDMVVLRFSYSQWMDLENQAQLTRYFNWRSTVKTNSEGQISNGKDSDFTFKFGASTLKIQMMEQLGVMVDGNFLGDPFSVYGRRAPVANDDTISLSEDDRPKTIDVLNSSRRGESDLVPDLLRSLDLASGYGPAHGTVSLQKNSANPADWKFIYAVDNSYYQSLTQGANASDSFKYQITDVNGKTATATVHVSIAGANDKASISGQDTYVLTEDRLPDTNNKLQVTGQLSVTDLDSGENQFSAVVTAASNNLGTLNLQPDGSFTYAINNADVQYLNTGTERKEMFTVMSRDGTASRDLVFITKGITDHSPPSASPDVIWVTDNSIVKLSASILLANDTDADSEKADLKIVSFSSGPDAEVGPELITDPVTGDDYFAVDASGLYTDQDNTYTYTLSDETGLTHQGAVTFKVKSLGDLAGNTLDLQQSSYAGAYLTGNTTVTALSAGAGPSVLIGALGASSQLQGGNFTDVLSVGDRAQVLKNFSATVFTGGGGPITQQEMNTTKETMSIDSNTLAGGDLAESSNAHVKDDKLSIAESLNVNMIGDAQARSVTGSADAGVSAIFSQSIRANQLYGDVQHLSQSAYGGADTLDIGVDMRLNLAAMARTDIQTLPPSDSRAVSNPELDVVLSANGMRGDADSLAGGSYGGDDALAFCDSLDIVVSARSVTANQAISVSGSPLSVATAAPVFKLAITSNDLYGDSISMDASFSGEDHLSFVNALNMYSLDMKDVYDQTKSALTVSINGNNLYERCSYDDEKRWRK